MKGLFTSRKFRQGTMATAITVVFVALVIVINFVATTLTSRYSLTLDLTPNKLFSITDETRQYLSELDQDVTIYILSTEENFTGRGDYYLQALEVLKKYALESSRITIEYEDLVANPAFAQNYPDLQLSSSSILITSGDRVRDVTPYDLYDIQSDNYGNGRVTASKAEQVLTSALLAVTSDSLINVGVMSGHGEESVDAFASLLQANNYMLGEFSILTEEIDPSYDVIIISAPQVDFSEEELKRLDRFLKNDGQYGKTLLYFPALAQLELPNLAGFLSDWGIAVGDGLVYETNPSLHVPQDQYMATVEYVDEEGVYSADLQTKKLVPMVAYARPLELLFENKSSVSAKTLLQFSATSGVGTGEQVGEDAAVTGPIPFMTISEYLLYEGTSPLRSYVVVGGSSTMVNEMLLSQPSLANSEYMLNLLGSLSGKEDDVKIQSKAIGDTTMNISAEQSMIIGLLLGVLFPLAVLITGIVIWARRRHR